MRWLHLHATNFRSWAEMDLDLSAVTAAVIVGDNGAGKSSLLTAGRYALYGQRVAKPLIRRGAEKMEVTLTVAQAGDVYRIIRGQTQGKTGQSWANIARKDANAPDGWDVFATRQISDVQDLIQERITGMDSAAYTASIFSPQGEAGEFARMDAAHRKDLLARLFGLEEFEPLADRAKERRSEKDLLIAVCDRQLEQARADADRLRDAASDTAEQDLVMIERRLAELETEMDDALARERVREQVTRRQAAIRALDELRRQSDSVNDANERRQTITSQLVHKPEVEQQIQALQAESQRQQEQYTAAIADASRARAAAADALAAARQQRSDTLNEWRAKKTELDRLISEGQGLQQQISQMRQQTAKVCVECSQPIPDETFQRQLSTRQQRVTQLRADHAALTAAMAPIMEHGQALKAAIENLETQVTAAEQATTAVPRPAPHPGELDGLRKQLDHLQRLEGELAALPADTLADIRRQISVLREEITSLPAEVPDGRTIDEVRTDQRTQEHAATGVRVRANAARAARQRLAEIDDQIVTLQADQAEHARDADAYAVLCAAYGRNGIPAILLDGAVEQIEVHANAVLQRIGANLSMEMRTQRDLAKGGRREVLDIIVHLASHEAPLETLSGGEKTRVFIALRQAIGEVLAARTGLLADFLAIDELTDVDENGMLAIGEMLPKLGHQVLVASHDPVLIDVMPTRITVTGGDGNPSRLAVS